MTNKGISSGIKFINGEKNIQEYYTNFTGETPGFLYIV